LLYAAYVTRIGGDFMAGRLYTPIVLLSVIVIGKFNFSKLPIAVGLAVSIAVIGVLQYANWFYPLVIADDDFKSIPSKFFVTNQIADEASYYALTGNLIFGFPDYHKRHGFYVSSLAHKDEKVYVFSNTGFARLAVSESTHIVDKCALTDPLLARLPTVYNANWRVGHLPRAIPDGYLETLKTGVNVIKDKQLAEYYGYLHEIISGDLFSAKRWEYIVNMNLGKYDYLIDKVFYRYCSLD
jgi:arabinofuranosyltransferase